MIADCSAVILAGGRSRRMGDDKATLQFAGQPLLQAVAQAVAPLFGELSVSVRAPRPDLPWPQICDAHVDAGPLAGLCAALGAVPTPWIFAVATDMPFVKPALIELLARRRAGFDAVVPRVHGHPQPLAAFYSARALNTLQTILASDGKHRLHSLRAALAQLNVCYLDESQLQESDPELRSFMDLDTPQDLDKARQDLAG